jgi:hypothetical protein
MTALATENFIDIPVDSQDSESTSLHFSFQHRNRSFGVWTRTDAEGPMVLVSCGVGHLPYSAENREGRRNGLMILSAVGATLSARLMLTEFHKISLLTSLKITSAEDLKSVVSGAAASVIGSLPLIELMEASLAPPGADKPA